MTVTVKGHEINYIDSGGDKPTILMLHGWGAPVSAYRSVLTPLEGRYRVIAPEMPGVGRSPDPGSPLTVEDYVDIAEGFAKTAR